MTSEAGSIIYLLQFGVVSVSPSVNTVFVCRDSCFLYQLDLNQKSSDTHTHAERCVFIFIFVDLFLIVCLYAICCCLSCILIKVLFILRPSSVFCQPRSPFFFFVQWEEIDRYMCICQIIQETKMLLSYFIKEPHLTNNQKQNIQLLPAWDSAQHAATQHFIVCDSHPHFTHCQDSHSHAHVMGWNVTKTKNM